MQAIQPVDETRLAQLSPAKWQALAQLASKQHVAPILYHRLKTQDLLRYVPSDIQQRLTTRQKNVTVNNLRRQAEFRRLVSAFDEANISVLALKGIYLASVVYPQIGLRQMGDLDLLVPIADTIRAAEIAQSLDYRLPRSLADVEREFVVAHHLPELVNADGFHLEIHGNLTRPGEIYSADPQVWWQDAVWAEIAGAQVKVLSPVDLLLHLCIHISFHHQFKADLRHYYDLVELTRFLGDTLDWDDVVRRAQTRQWNKGVGLTLKIAQQLFGLPLPPAIRSLTSGPDLESMMQFALPELWQTSVAERRLFSRDVAQFQYEQGFLGRIRYIVRRIFIPREVMAQKYPVRANSMWVYPYYLVRVKNLIRDHADTVWDMSRGVEKTVDSADRKHRLGEWLTKP